MTKVCRMATRYRTIDERWWLATEAKDWLAARALFVDGPMDFDMSSLVGGGAVKLAAEQLF
jgi:hypothetical protein